MSLYKQFKTNKDAELNGVEYEVIDGVKFLIARLKQAYYLDMAEVNRRFKNEISRNIESDELKKARIKVFVTHCVKGWSGVTDEEDKPLKFNVSNAVAVLFDLPDLFELLVYHAQNAENYNASVLEEQAKN